MDTQDEQEWIQQTRTGNGAALHCHSPIGEPMNHLHAFLGRLGRFSIPRSVAVTLATLAGSGLVFGGEIHEVAKFGDLVKATALLKTNPDLAVSKDESGRTPLHWAAANGHKAVVELLLAYKIDVNAKDPVGNPPLYLALWKDHIAIAELLLAHNATCTLQDAAAIGDLARAKTLLQANPALVSSKDSDGSTPLHWAVDKNHKDVVELLLTLQANVNAETHFRSTPLFFAKTKDVAELLLAKGAAVNAKNNQGVTPLHMVAVRGHKEVAEFLIANRADVNAKTGTGNAPLHDAAIKGHRDVIELLLRNKADIEAKNKFENTPLHEAIMAGQKSAVELLLAKGANVNAQNNHGVTALRMAMDWRRSELADLLRRHGGHE